MKDYVVLARKIPILIIITSKSLIYGIAILVVLVIRMIRPLVLFRFGKLHSDRIGHFAANTEMYLCERDSGINTHSYFNLDFFCFDELICNDQLATMWRRHLYILPSWALEAIRRVNRIIPGGAFHEISVTQSDRDVNNLYDQLPPHLTFTVEEEERGKAGLLAMGIPINSRFVCLNVRDSAYLDAHQEKDWSYHNYRDSSISNYLLAAEELADRGYLVIRMGARVHSEMKCNHQGVIDYATNGMRNDFMDIYLCAKCEFMISTGEGLICVPKLFRRPVVVVNLVPLGYYFSYYANLIGLTKHHFLLAESKELTLKEIFTQGVGFSLRTADFHSRGIQLVENTPEEIRDVAVEMAERLNGTWQVQHEDEFLQRRFWEIFPVDAVDIDAGKPLHGAIHARFGAAFLRNNKSWLE